MEFVLVADQIERRMSTGVDGEPLEPSRCAAKSR
jgi:hypothetical protein